MSRMRFVSYWPQPSLNGTHMTMLGKLRLASMIAFHSRTKFSSDSFVRWMSGWLPLM